MRAMGRSFGYLAAVLMLAGCCTPSLRAAAVRQLKDESGKPILDYIVEAPANVAPSGTTDPARQVGVIFCSQEHGTPTGMDLYPVRESLKRLGLSDQFVLLAAHSQDPAGKMMPEDQAAFLKLLKWAEKNYPVNPRRVYMYGKGEGGKISGEFAVMHPDVVTAAISYSWGWWSMPSELEKPIDMESSAAEFDLVLGLRDLSHHVTTVRDTYERLRAKGYHTIYREFDDLGDRSYHPVSNDDAFSWATRLRNKNLPPSAQEMNLLKAFSGSNPPAPVSGYYSTLALVGGSAAGEVLQRLFVSTDASVRAAAAETCSHGIFGEATSAALGKLLADPAPQVRGAALRAIASYANWRSPAAQQVLIRRATDKSLDLDARLDAADGLGQAVRLQAAGVPQDPPMFRALVSLLREREKNEPLAAAAYIALAPVRPYMVGDAGETEFTPHGGWEKWLDKITTEQAGDGVYYRVCPPAGSTHAGGTPVDLFCAGGDLVAKNPAKAFQSTLKAAEAGYVPAQEVVGMMYAVGKGVQQDYHEAAKWFLTATEAGDLRAAANYMGAGRSGLYNLRGDADLGARWAKFLAANPEYSPVPGR
jgi:hypothetical protein